MTWLIAVPSLRSEALWILCVSASLREVYNPDLKQHAYSSSM